MLYWWRGRRFGRNKFFDLFASRPATRQKLIVDRLLQRSDHAGAWYRVFGYVRTAGGNQNQHVLVACISKPPLSRTGRNDDGGQIGRSVSDHCAECNTHVAKQHGLDPFRTDIPAERCDDETVLAPMDGQKAVRIERPEITGPPGPLRGALPQIAVGNRRPIDHDLTVVDRHIESVERSTNRIGAAFAWPVHCHNRATFGKAITLVHWYSQLPGLFSHLPGHRCTPDCHETK